jgi:hypothetical protein
MTLVGEEAIVDGVLKVWGIVFHIAFLSNPSFSLHDS